MLNTHFHSFCRRMNCHGVAKFQKEKTLREQFGLAGQVPCHTTGKIFRQSSSPLREPGSIFYGGSHERFSASVYLPFTAP